MKRIFTLFIFIVILINIKENQAASPTLVVSSELFENARYQAIADGHTNLYLTNIGTRRSHLKSGLGSNTNTLKTGTCLDSIDINLQSGGNS